MAKQSVLEIIRRVAPRVGIQRPATAVGSTDVQIQQLVELLNEEGQELAKRFVWQATIKEKTFSTIAAEDQGLLVGGAILTAADGFKYILNDTLWDRTTQYQVGVSSPTRWQGEKALITVGPYSRYRLRGGRLLMFPAPAAGLTVAFEYITENWVSNVAGDTFRAEFTLDDDFPLLDSQLLIMGLKWRWKSAKGLSYAEEMQSYEMAVADATTRDIPAATVSMDGPDSEMDTFRPYIVVPAGSWGV